MIAGRPDHAVFQASHESRLCKVQSLGGTGQFCQLPGEECQRIQVVARSGVLMSAPVAPSPGTSSVAVP